LSAETKSSTKAERSVSDDTLQLVHFGQLLAWRLEEIVKRWHSKPLRSFDIKLPISHKISLRFDDPPKVPFILYYDYHIDESKVDVCVLCCDINVYSISISSNGMDMEVRLPTKDVISMESHLALMHLAASPSLRNAIKHATSHRVSDPDIAWLLDYINELEQPPPHFPIDLIINDLFDTSKEIVTVELGLNFGTSLPNDVHSAMIRLLLNPPGDWTTTRIEVELYAKMWRTRLALSFDKASGDYTRLELEVEKELGAAARIVETLVALNEADAVFGKLVEALGSAAKLYALALVTFGLVK